MAFKKVSHVLFDLDGLLIDSEEIYFQAYEKVCAKYGKKFTWENYASLMGFQEHETHDKIMSTFELSMSKDQFATEAAKEYTALFPQMRLKPGAKRLVEHLHKKDVPIALATSSAEESVDMKMKNYHEFLNLFHHKIMGASNPAVKRGKPDPAIFLVCASAFPDKPKSENCLVFEDAVNGMKAALAAGMQVVAVPDSHVNPDLFSDATLVLKSLDDFKPELFGLPPYD